MIEQFKNKKGIIVFSDPGGAKACLVISKSLKKSNIMLVSDRDYEFYNEFGVNVISSFKNNINECFKLFKPEFVLTGTSFPEKIELNFIREATLKKIRTFSFVDHWINIKKRFVSEGEYVYPSEIWVIDKLAKQKALEENIPPELIKITGNPYYKYLSNWKPNLSKSELYKKLNLNLLSKYILYAPEPISTFNLKDKYGFDELSGLIHLENGLKKSGLKNFCILVKGHPNQNDKVFLNYIDKTKLNIKYVKNQSINELIYHSEVVVGYFSNSLIEATKMNKKVFRLLIDLCDLNLDPFKEMEIGKKIYNLKELNYEIRNLLI